MVQRKRLKKRGKIFADQGTYVEFIQIAQELNYEVTVHPKYLTNISDTHIAEAYGKGNVLLTHDKTAYQHNVKDGFLGYVEYDSMPKHKIKSCLDSVRDALSSTTTKELKGYRLQIDYVAKKHRKVKM